MKKYQDEKAFYLNSIFEKDPTGVYTKDALLYQDFMKYIFVKKENPREPLRLRDFAKWIIKNNLEISNYYTGSSGHIPISNRIAHHDRKFKNIIHNLQRSSLIGVVRTQKAEKNKEMIPVYGYTDEGLLIAYLISYIEKEKKKGYDTIDNTFNTNKILDIIKSLLSRYNSYISDFVVNLYVNAWEKGFANSIIESLSKVLHDNTNNRNLCGNVIDALNRCLYHHLEEEPHKHAFFDLWMKTINDFDSDVRKIILYHHKAENENILSLCQPPKDWEQLWVKSTHDFSTLVLYGICAKCRIGHPFVVDYFKYQKERVANGYLLTNCEKCKTEGSFYVSPHILKYPPPFENS